MSWENQMADVTTVFWLESVAKMVAPTQHRSLVARWHQPEVGNSAITQFAVCAISRAPLCPTLSAHQMCKGA